MANEGKEKTVVEKKANGYRKKKELEFSFFSLNVR